MSSLERVQLCLPPGRVRLLLHVCCASCSCEVIEALVESGVEFSVFFYNPNIHPKREYLIRKEENIRFAKKNNITTIDADYDVRNWFKRVEGFENAPERGERCTLCFDMRLERTALHAFENGFDCITSSLGVSRWKNMTQVNVCGHRAVARYKNAVVYWDYNWRKKGGSMRMIEIAKREEFYQQEYCGCVYSLRETNAWRVKNNRQQVNIGFKYYHK